MHPDDYDHHRRLGKPTHEQLVKEDFKMDIAINGNITKTMEREEWLSHTGTFGVEFLDLHSRVFFSLLLRQIRVVLHQTRLSCLLFHQAK